MEKINDRIGEYLIPHLSDYIFDELSENYLEKADVKDILDGVPVPINKKELNGITVLKIAKSMAFVIGCDVNFKYRDNYIQYILKNFDKRFSMALVSEGLNAAEKHDYDYANIMFRAAFLIDPDNGNAYYCYGRACKDAYEQAEGDNQSEDFVGRYKAEALYAFEIATVKNPDLAESFYFLGYQYVNLGLYLKAKLTWEEYIKKLSVVMEKEEKPEVKKEYQEAKEEIEGRLKQLEIPIKIEEGYNMVLSGKFEDGIKTLEPYKTGQFNTWWPLWYYIGIAYENIAEKLEEEKGSAELDELTTDAYKEAEENFLEVLKLSPSNSETMEELVNIYGKLGDKDKKEKYEKKLEVVKHNQELDKEEKNRVKNNEQ